MASRRTSKGAQKSLKVKDLGAGSKRAKAVKGGGGGVPGLTAGSIQKVGAVGPCFRPIGVVGPCDRPR
jgi:hypothetical protein